MLNEALEQQAVLRLDGIFPLQESGLKSDDIAYGMFRKICASNSAIHQRLSLIKNCKRAGFNQFRWYRGGIVFRPNRTEGFFVVQDSSFSILFERKVLYGLFKTC